MCGRRVGIVLAWSVLFGPGTSNAPADWIKLRNGGEMRGKIVSDSGTSQSDRISIETLSGTRIDVHRDAIESIVRRSIKREEYEVRAAAIPNTADGHWKMAEWCRENRLTTKQVAHLERVTEIDPQHEAAHLKLGHVMEDGEWMTRDELMKSRGFVKHKGRYVTETQFALITKTDKQRDSEREWRRKVRLWHKWLTGPKTQRRAVAINELRTVNDPDAVPALSHYFAESPNEEWRQLYVDVLAGIGGKRPVEPLVWQSLVDPSKSVRVAAIEGIAPEHSDYASIGYSNGLKHPNHQVVRRAALGLGTLGSEESVPELIDALVTQHAYQERVYEQQPSNARLVRRTVSRHPCSSSDTVSYQAISPEMIEYQRQLRTTGGLGGIYGLPPAGPVRSRVVTKTYAFRNQAARDALQELTGEEFGFNQREWRAWWEAKQASQPKSP